MKKQKKIKMNMHHAETIDEAIDDLHTFLDCDMYSKFRPETVICGQKLCRQDFFRNEREFIEYLGAHFNILRKEIKRIRKQRKQHA